MANAVVPIRPDLHGEAPAQVFLQPIAAPSILGLYGFAGATFMVAARMAHWFGGPGSDIYLAPFAAVLGGLAQFIAGMWAYKARDGVATAMHGLWGSFWIAYGILNIGFASGALHEPQGAFPAFGFWFIVLAAITWAGAAAAAAENKVITAVLGFLAGGCTLAAIGFLGGWEAVKIAGGWLFIVSAFIAWYAATGLMLESAFGHAVFPMGKTQHVREAPKFAPGIGEPGVMHGQ